MDNVVAAAVLVLVAVGVGQAGHVPWTALEATLAAAARRGAADRATLAR